jgi:hypothetical protein
MPRDNEERIVKQRWSPDIRRWITVEVVGGTVRRSGTIPRRAPSTPTGEPFTQEPCQNHQKGNSEEPEEP